MFYRDVLLEFNIGNLLKINKNKSSSSCQYVDMDEFERLCSDVNRVTQSLKKAYSKYHVGEFADGCYLLTLHKATAINRLEAGKDIVSPSYLLSVAINDKNKITDAKLFEEFKTDCIESATNAMKQLGFTIDDDYAKSTNSSQAFIRPRNLKKSPLKVGGYNSSKYKDIAVFVYFNGKYNTIETEVYCVYPKLKLK